MIVPIHRETGAIHDEEREKTQGVGRGTMWKSQDSWQFRVALNASLLSGNDDK